MLDQSHDVVHHCLHRTTLCLDKEASTKIIDTRPLHMLLEKHRRGWSHCWKGLLRMLHGTMHPPFYMTSMLRRPLPKHKATANAYSFMRQSPDLFASKPKRQVLKVLSFPTTPSRTFNEAHGKHLKSHLQIPTYIPSTKPFTRLL